MKTTLLALGLLLAFPAFGAGVDAATCGGCHDDVVSAFARAPHGAAMTRRSRAVLASSCVACAFCRDSSARPAPARCITSPVSWACSDSARPAGANGPPSRVNSIPADWLFVIALESVEEESVELQLLLVATTFVPRPRSLVARLIALTALAVVPLPPESRNFSGMIWTFQSTPTTPTRLFPTAPIVPAVCVP